MTAVGVERIVTAGARSTLTISETTILTSAVVAVMLALTAIGATSAGQRPGGTSRMGLHLSLAVATMAFGLGVRFASPVTVLAPPVTLIVVIAGCASRSSACR